MNVQAPAELVSLVLTIPTVVLALSVVYMWLPAAREAWHQETRTGHHWFVMGVTLGFVGSAIDNVYWFLPWTAAYLQSPYFETLTAKGVFFNIFFRQGLGIAAAYCHIRAAALSADSRIRFVNRLLVASTIGGMAYGLLLILATKI